MDQDRQAPDRLKRELGVGGATLMGLGSMVGTGVFVSIGVAAGEAGPAVVLAIVLAAAVAACNALSSAQLAASHAVSGGTYEYGYRYLNSWLGFTAGWMFLCAKTASAATAAIGFGGYFLQLLGRDPVAAGWLGAAAAGLFTLLVLGGVRRSSLMNIAIVSVTLLALAAFVVFGAPAAADGAGANLLPMLPAGEPEAWRRFLYATALMFVAFTGYGRVATLGEEIRDPRRNIPRAIITTLLVTSLLYVAVALVAIGAVGAERFAAAADRATPLGAVAQALGTPWLGPLVAVGAVTAMLGVLLNLILGLSRVALAMGRRDDLPPAFGRLDAKGEAPAVAVIAVGVSIAAIAAFGGVETAWAFSAFTVLVYYAITNLAALRLPAAERLYPRVIAWAGLAACLFLAFWVPPAIWGLGLLLIGGGLLWRLAASRLWGRAAR